MTRLILDLPDSLDAALAERARQEGAASKEAYLLQLVEAEGAAGRLEQVLTDRVAGPFEAFESDWKDRVRAAARARMRG